MKIILKIMKNCKINFEEKVYLTMLVYKEIKKLSTFYRYYETVKKVKKNHC